MEFQKGAKVWTLLLDEEGQTTQQATLRKGTVPPKSLTFWDEGTVQGKGSSAAYVIQTESQGLVESSIDNIVVVGQHPKTDDLTHLLEPDEPTILDFLKQRYQSNLIYTYIGHMLLAINPYQTLPKLYGEKQLQEYANAHFDEKPAHIYAIAHSAQSDLKGNLKDQGIIVSGESGAGKTESAKYIIQLLTNSSRIKSSSGLENILSYASPILESFGNAATQNNNNSSRFSRLIEIIYDTDTDIICGAKVSTYLLEQSRISTTPLNERNFHALYEACVQDNTNPSTYQYLNSSLRSPRDDRQSLEELKVAFQATGFSHIEVQNIWNVLLGILWLGNITFENVEGAKEACRISDASYLLKAATFFDLDKTELQDALTQKGFKAATNRKSSYTLTLGVKQATETRDALAKVVYSKLFSWIVSKINLKLNTSRGVQNSKSIFLFDIFGFESVFQNSLEQLNINFANEALHQLFVDSIFKKEQQDYINEGIPWKPVQTSSISSASLQLLAAKPTGILSLLDEQCVLPNGSDQSFFEKVKTVHASNAHFEIPRIGKPGSFQIKHFAGPVSYSIDDLVTKNKNVVNQDLVDLLSTSRNPFFVNCIVPATDKTSSKTICGQFKENLTTITRTLESTNVHFIRCLRPNEQKKANCWENKKMLQQLRYTGALDSIQVKRNGYYYRQPFSIFCEAFKLVIDSEGIRDSNPKDIVTTLLSKPHLNAGNDQWALGKTFLFMKERQLQTMQDLKNRLLEKERQERLRRLEQQRREEEQKRREEEEQKRREEEERKRKQEEEEKQRKEKEKDQEKKLEVIQQRQERSETNLAKTLQFLNQKKTITIVTPSPETSPNSPKKVSAASITKGKSRVAFATVSKNPNAIPAQPRKQPFIPLSPSAIHARDTLRKRIVKEKDDKAIKAEAAERKEVEARQKKAGNNSLAGLNTQEIVKTLESSFKTNKGLMFLDDNLVFINPYTDLPPKKTLSDEMRQWHLSEQTPSIQGYAAYVLKKIVQQQAPHWVVFKGGTAGGKTELMKNFVTSILAAAEATTLEDYISATDWVLEQFSHYRSPENRNKTAQFTRTTQIEFDRNGKAVAASLNAPFVEADLISSRPNECRSFHIFYQLLSGPSTAQLEELELAVSTSDFSWLRNSKLLKADRELFQITDSALDAINIRDSLKQDVFKILSCILNLGNIEFRQNGEDISVVDMKPIEKVAKLLGIRPQDLVSGFTIKQIGKGQMTGNLSMISIPYTLEEAELARTNLATVLYERLFNWIISIAEQTIRRATNAKSERTNLFCNIIESPGRLDQQTPGLKLFKRDAITDLIHKIYVRNVLENTQTAALGEGVPTPRVKVNRAAHNAYELMSHYDHQVGILPLISRHSREDFDHNTFTEALQKNNNGLLTVTPDKYQFAIKHFFGTSTYDYREWFCRNNVASLAAYQFLEKSTSPIIQSLFKESKATNRKSVRSVQGSVLRTTIFGKYLNNFEASIKPDQTGISFVHCISPNPSYKKEVFDCQWVSDQVTHLNIDLEASQRSYAIWGFKEFLFRFNLLDPQTRNLKGADFQRGAEVILKRFNFSAGKDYYIGKTKVFLTRQTSFYLEKAREKTLPEACTTISSVWRGYLVRKKSLTPSSGNGPARLIALAFSRWQAKKWAAQLKIAVRSKSPWPPAPATIEKGVSLLRTIFGSQNSLDIITNLEPEEEEVLRLKVTALNIFSEKKFWDPARRFENEYFELHKKEKAKQLAYLENLLKQNRENLIVFGDYVNKVNKRGKVQYRAMIVTERNIWKHDPKTYKLKKEATPLSCVISIHLSPYSDGFVVVKCSRPHRDFIIDLGVTKKEKYSEFVAGIVDIVRNRGKRQIPVIFEPSINYNNSRTEKDYGKDLLLTFCEDSKAKEHFFKSTKTGGTVFYPPK